MNETIIDGYQGNALLAQQEITKNERLINIYSFLRLGVFGLVLVAIYFSVYFDSYILLAVFVAILAGMFAALIRKQNGYEYLAEYYKALKKVNENEIGSIQSRANIYDNGAEYKNEKHHYSDDLDIFGKSSLYQLINRAATSGGRDTLAAWLDTCAQKPEILFRQQAVQEITRKNDLKLDLQARLLFSNNHHKEQLPQLYTYLRMPLNLPGENWLSIYSKVAPYLSLLAIILSFYFVEARYVLGVLLIINNRITSSKGEYVDKTDLIAGKIGGVLKHYADAFSAIENAKWESDLCVELVGKVKTESGAGTSGKIRGLSVLINNLNVRLNMFAGAVLNAFLLWNIRQIIAIENWKRSNQQNIEEAFVAVAQLEALMSLAGLKINYPDWNFPEIAEGEGYTVSAKRIAHPLINPKNRIENDYELTDAFKIDIITGSNMAGKSTFLRTIGINAVLGLCGAPVCAESMQLSVIRVLTYMRIKDSLNESTSTFKAELDRLQMLLAAVEHEDKVFFLIDEMLRGTNSVDKYLGSKAVIEQLIRKKGVGQVATHDLQIADLENEYPDYVRNYYFDIQVKDGQMLFDYKIKHGACKTFNASILLKQIGIDVNPQ